MASELREESRTLERPAPWAISCGTLEEAKLLQKIAHRLGGSIAVFVNVENTLDGLSAGKQALLRGAMARVQELADACTDEYDRIHS